MELLNIYKILKKHNISLLQACTLQIIHGSQTKTSDLAVSFGITSSAITHQIDAMIRKRLIVRYHPRDERDDRRVILLGLTELGARVLDEILHEIDQASKSEESDKNTSAGNAIAS